MVVALQHKRTYAFAVHTQKSQQSIACRVWLWPNWKCNYTYISVVALISTLNNPTKDVKPVVLLSGGISALPNHVSLQYTPISEAQNMHPDGLAIASIDVLSN